MAMAVALAQAHFYYANVNFPFRSWLYAFRMCHSVQVVPSVRFPILHILIPVRDAQKPNMLSELVVCRVHV